MFSLICCSAFIVILQHGTCYLARTMLPWFLTSACHVMCTKVENTKVQARYEKHSSHVISYNYCFNYVGGEIAKWLVRCTPYRVVRVRVLAEVIVSCSWATGTLLLQCLSPSKSKLGPAHCQGNLTKMLGATCDGLASNLGE